MDETAWDQKSKELVLTDGAETLLLGLFVSHNVILPSCTYLDSLGSCARCFLGSFYKFPKTFLLTDCSGDLRIRPLLSEMSRRHVAVQLKNVRTS